MTNTCFTSDSTTPSIPISLLISNNFPQWLETQSPLVKNLVGLSQFKGKPETFCLIPDEKGKLTRVVAVLNNPEDFWSLGGLPLNLPQNIYHIESDNTDFLTRATLAWGLGAYQFTRYKAPEKTAAQLLIDKRISIQTIGALLEAVYWARDLINLPTQDLSPEIFAEEAQKLAKKFNASLSVITGDDLLKQNYPAIHAVGRGSKRPPCLIDLRWGNPQHPKITLVGKGVCFDSGGFDIKTAAGMLDMKKDMGGGAIALGLASYIMAMNLPVQLRVLVPAVENLISGNAYKPGDIIRTRKGLTAVIGNTDAEGRVILCDALAEASTEKPELLLDFATLTGAARVALGTDVSALFTDHDKLAEQLLHHSKITQDPIWRLPLYAPYRKLMDSPIADINNVSSSPYGGAITAALFLKEFVPPEIAWAHFDLMGANEKLRPGRPEGGEAMTLLAVASYLTSKFS